MYRKTHIASLLITTLLFCSCSIIDEDLSKCGRENKIDYQLRLLTNIQSELETELSATAEEREVAEALRARLAGIFTETAHDVDLSFYNTTDLARDKHEEHIMDASQASYTIYLPVREYIHLALANIVNAANVRLTDDNSAAQSRLQQTAGDTIGSHTTGLFTARLPISVTAGEDKTFNVKLYMANSAAALVIDTAGVSGIKDIKIYSSGFAESFALRDSTYAYGQKAPVVRSVAVPMNHGHYVCRYTVNFPSYQQPVVRATEEYWRFMAYVTLPDGTITENIISIQSPLLPEHLRVVKMKLKDDGGLQAVTGDVGVSVKLDWKQGGTFEPEL